MLTEALTFTDELVQEQSVRPVHEVHLGEPPPPEFVRLSPREREQWHACRIFFLRRRWTDTGGCGFGRHARPRDVVLEFSIGPRDYLALPDAHARCELLLREGCPEGIIDLADEAREYPGDYPAGPSTRRASTPEVTRSLLDEGGE